MSGYTHYLLRGSKGNHYVKEESRSGSLYSVHGVAMTIQKETGLPYSECKCLSEMARAEALGIVAAEKQAYQIEDRQTCRERQLAEARKPRMYSYMKRDGSIDDMRFDRDLRNWRIKHNIGSESELSNDRNEKAREFEVLTAKEFAKQERERELVRKYRIHKTDARAFQAKRTGNMYGLSDKEMARFEREFMLAKVAARKKAERELKQIMAQVEFERQEQCSDTECVEILSEEDC